MAFSLIVAFWVYLDLSNQQPFLLVTVRFILAEQLVMSTSCFTIF